MALVNLEDKLQPQNSPIALDQALVGSRIADFLANHLNADSIAIQVASPPATQNDVLVVPATCSILGLQDAPIELRLAQVDGQLELALELATPADWAFSHSFEDLKNSFFDQLELSNAALILSTYAHRDEQRQIDLIDGLSFYAVLKLDGPLDQAKFLLNDAEQVRVYGPIAFEHDATIVSLDMLDAHVVDLGTQTLPISMRLFSVYLDDFQAITAGIEIATQLAVAGAQLAVAAQLPLSGSFLFIEGTFAGVQLPSLSDLAALVGGDDLAQSLPDGVLANQGLSILGAGLGLNLQARTLASASFTLGAPDWDVVPNSLTIGNTTLYIDVVSPLNSAARSISLTLGGEIKTPNTAIDIIARIPDFSVQGGLAPGSSPTISDLLDDFAPAAIALPDGVPNFTVAGLDFALEPRSGNLGLLVMLAGSWDVVPSALSLTGLLLQLERQAGAVAARIAGSAAIGGADVQVIGDFGADVVLSGSIDELSLSALADDLLAGAGLPDELPDIVFSDINVSVAPKTGAFHLDGTCSVALDLPFGAEGLAVSTATIHVERGPASGSGVARTPGELTCAIALECAGPVTIVDGLVFKTTALTFSYDQAAGWSLAGAIAAAVFDHDLALSARLDVTPTQRQVVLAATDSSKRALVELQGVGALSAEALTITISKALAPSAGAASVSLNAASPYSWDVSAAGAIALDNVFELAGTLRLFKLADRAGLVFKASNAEVAIPLPVPGRDMATHLGFDYLSIIRSTPGAGAASWAFDADVDVWFSGLPQRVQDRLADKIAGHFKADADQTLVAIERVLAPVELAIPPAKAGSITIELGDALLDASNFSLRLGSDLRLSTDLGFGLPAHLNDIFGTHDDGSPSVRFFNTYVPGDDASVTKLQLGITTAGGLTAQCVTSPIAAIRRDTSKPGEWWKASLGDFGKLDFEMPAFSYTGSSFSAKGGFTQDNLQVPLTPLKLLLSACGLDALSRKLPKGLPLQTIDVIGDDGRLNVDGLVAALDLPSEANKVIDLIQDRVEALPDQFKSYLNITIPQGFTFNIAVTPDGGASIDIRVQGDQPLKLLYPSFGLLGPRLTGVELHRVTFRELLSGSLFALNLDMVIDQFDLATLAAALALPLDQLPILPSSKDLSQRLILKNLFMLIIYETGIPVPIPIYFDELAYEYQGLEGLALQTHWSLAPAPHLEIGAIAQLFGDFEQFFTKHDYLLDPNKPPQGLDVALTVGANYLKLPPYLGGKLLGTATELAPIGAYSNLAHLLNALKTLSLNELIQTIPLDDRVGSESIAFGIMSAQAAWLITTPQEFRDTSFARLGIAGSEVDALLGVLPPHPDSQQQGLVVFLKGAWSAASAALDIQFGLVGTASGFGVGLHFAGRIGDIIGAEFRGVVLDAIGGDPAAPTGFKLDASSTLTIANRPVFAGDLQIDDQHFLLSGDVNLFPADSALQIGAHGVARLDRQGAFLFNAAAAVALANFTLIGANITISNSGVVLSGTWLGVPATFSLQVQGDDVTLTGTVSPGLAINTDVGPIVDPTTHIKVFDRFTLDTSASATLAVTLGTRGFAAHVSGAFKWHDLNPSFPSFDIAVAPSDVKDLADQVGEQIRQHASEIFTDLIHQTHIDTPFVPAVNITTPHADTPFVPAVNITTPHADTPFVPAVNITTPHADTPFVPGINITTPHADTPFVPGINITTPHADAWIVPHTDTSVPHFDVPHADKGSRPFHFDTPHGDTGGHADVGASGHTDIAAQHQDSSPTAHVDVATKHQDSSPTAHVDVATKHQDSASTAHVDIATQHADTPATAHVDTP